MFVFCGRKRKGAMLTLLTLLLVNSSCAVKLGELCTSLQYVCMWELKLTVCVPEMLQDGGDGPLV